MRYILIGCISLMLGAQARTDAPDPSDFAILPWGWLDWADEDAAETLEDLKACGFNLAGFVAPEDMDAVRAAGLQAFVRDSRVHAPVRNEELTEEEARTVAEAVTAPWLDDPAVFGYYLVDEPSARYAPNLGILAHAIQDAHPGAIPYVNLLPNYADTTSQLRAESYEAYLEAYAEALPSDYLSYDHYALIADGSLRGGYFENLESVRNVTLAHDMPFWNIVLSNRHFFYSDPTPAGLRFQAYTSLAYGARGISYFTYFSPGIGNYRLAPIDQFGNKTPTWDMLREVNLALHKLVPTYVGLKSINVFHQGNVPEGSKDESAAELVKELSWFPHIETRPEQTGAVVGEFLDEAGNPYAMVVNKNLHDDVRFDISFHEEGAVELISPYTGNPTNFSGEQKWLAAGQGMLLRVMK